jgi:dethiobiotin synthetase
MKALFITATDTGVGKTVVTLLLALSLREKGVNALCMKPFATGGRRSHDAYLYKKYISPQIPYNLINPIFLSPPLSPFSASLLTGESVKREKAFEAYEVMLKKADFLLVEGIGGLLVPIEKGYLLSDFLKELNIPFLLVTRPTLGTLNHTLLSLYFAEKEGLCCKGILINYARRKKEDVATATNPEVLKRFSGKEILATIPYKKGLTQDKGRLLSLARELNLSNILSQCSSH